MGSPGETTNVEWSHLRIGAPGSNQNIVGNTEGGINFSAVNDYILKTGYTIKTNNHSHVYDNIVSGADRRQAGKMNAKFPNATSHNYFKGVYTPYNSKGPVLPYSLAPVIVKP